MTNEQLDELKDKYANYAGPNAHDIHALLETLEAERAMLDFVIQREVEIYRRADNGLLGAVWMKDKMAHGLPESGFPTGRDAIRAAMKACESEAQEKENAE